MTIPLFLTKEQLDSPDFNQCSVEEIKSKQNGEYFNDVELYYRCYIGPCVNGSREVCYKTDNGCGACRWIPDIC
ncbi:hypothetical protein N5D16_15840 [Acinetobacter johnsonii]|uniref:hypothetical protein n=1 Tax=Acinetobacter johnsonii TaxID=40214 RepID=UPI002449EA8B|nr:hypothetical protein [Acinetobacter johnsonii]MDH1365863.1 hypothetical protein [Acinetobacter johnsonii]MDH1520438.1 hypothetical protein [Acinetobacter johnsonii]